MISIEIIKAKKSGSYVWLSGIEYEGVRLWFYENGNLFEYSSWKNNKRHGERKWYRENGNLREHSFWSNGSKHGEFKYFYENGNLWKHYIYENGKLIKALLED